MSSFDAKSLLEAVVAGNTQTPAPSEADLSNLLNQVMQAAPGGSAAGAGGLGGMLGQVLGGAGGAGGLGGLLNQVLGGATGQGAAASGTTGGTAAAGGIGGALGQILSQASGPGGLGNAADIARSIFGNATQGVQDAANQSAATPALDDIIKQISGGPGGADLIAKARQIIAANPGAAGALAGALGTLLVGTGAGRVIAANAAKVGGLVLIGGLAYKAYENYKNGQSTSASAGALPVPAPAGTGFEPQAQTNETALLYIRAMVAAASSTGTVSATERAKITAMLQQAGHSADAAAFLEKEMAHPASVTELAAGARSPEVAAQTYMAARMAIEAHSPAETAFLAQLATALKLNPALVQHIDAAATANKV